MKQGAKVKHSTFAKDEWIRQIGVVIFTEDGYQKTQEDFWHWRQSEGFDEGWTIVPEDHYVWLNINTGEFSNSWIKDITKGWKLIKYRCVNEPLFKFYDKMKIK
jgi:hypothetical protein